MNSPADDSQFRIQTICLMTLAAIAATFTVYWLRPVLVPFVVAVFVVSGFSPVLVALEKKLGVNRLVAAALTFLAGVLVLSLFGFTIWASMVDLSNNSEAYRKRVRELVAEVESRIPLNLNQPEASVETSDGATESPLVGPERPGSPSEMSRDRASQFVDSFVRQGITAVSQAFISMVSTSVVVLIYVFFLLIGTPTVHQSDTVREVDLQIRSYLGLKTVISIFTGFAFGLALRLFGVPMAFTFGVMAFLLNFVPNVGPLVASLLPIPLIVLDPDGSILWMISTICVISGIQLISGNLVEPKIMGNSSDLHPVTILLALMFWGMMWGIIGMFLATPITAAVKIVLERIEQTRPLANLMAGRMGEASEPSTAAQGA